MKRSSYNFTRTVMTHPIHFLAFGFGIGLMPFAPGTFGSLLGFLLFFTTRDLGFDIQLIIALSAFFSGVWICGASAKKIGEHDYKGIVWDEIVGMYVTLLAVSFSLINSTLAFILFRLMDILKPWPINYLDKKIKGGLGIMLDDLFAAFYSIILLLTIKFVFDV